MASLLSGNRKSLLDAPIGIDAQRARDEDSANIRMDVQNHKRQISLGNRAYRNAVRNKDYKSAMQALDWMKNNTGSAGAGQQSSVGIHNLMENRRNIAWGKSDRMGTLYGNQEQNPQSSIEWTQQDDEDIGLPSMKAKSDAFQLLGSGPAYEVGKGSPMEAQRSLWTSKMRGKSLLDITPEDIQSYGVLGGTKQSFNDWRKTFKIQ